MTNEALIRDLRDALGEMHVLHLPEDLIAYEYDATIDRARPDAVVFPASTADVSAAVRIANVHDVPVVPRGSGTGLAGGAIPVQGGVVVAMTRMRRIVELNAANRIAVVEPGVINLDLQAACEQHGLRYAPDPSSQRICTIGGNVGTNAGGPHTLAHGSTVNHVLGVEVVLADGAAMWLGGRQPDVPGPDLRGVFCGSEGTLGIVTQICVALTPLPHEVRTMLAIFDSVEVASEAVSAIISSGVVPVALEMLDHEIIQIVESQMHVGYPLDAGAVLLIEVEGLTETVAADAERVVAACEGAGARELRVAESAAERDRLWEGRKGGIGAIGASSPNFYILDGVVPRTRLPEVMSKVNALADEYGFRCANIFHAGDGNLHPNIMFNELDPGATERVLELGGEIMRVCVDAGGSITGEHGVGLEKRSYMEWIFSDADLDAMGQSAPGLRGRRALQPVQGAADRARLRLRARRRDAPPPGRARRVHLAAMTSGTADLRDALPAEGERPAPGYVIDGAAPHLAQQPRTREEVAKLLASAGEAGLAVVPQGSRTALDLGRPIDRYDIALDMRGLGRHRGLRAGGHDRAGRGRDDAARAACAPRRARPVPARRPPTRRRRDHRRPARDRAPRRVARPHAGRA